MNSDKRKETPVVVFSNNKGGVAKTSSAIATAGVLFQMGKKVLFVDGDPQCNSTKSLNGFTGEGVATIIDLIADNGTMDEVIQKENVKEAKEENDPNIRYFDLIPGDEDLNSAEEFMRADIFCLKKHIDQVKDNYDIVIFDTSPAINILLTVIYTAATHIVIPVEPDPFSADGIETLYRYIEEERENANPDLKIAGILITQFDGRTNVSQIASGMIAQIAALLKTKIFKTKIRDCVRVTESQIVSIPLTIYRRKCTASDDYYRFVNELLETIDTENKGLPELKHS